jgi:hypothetical protein
MDAKRQHRTLVVVMACISLLFISILFLASLNIASAAAPISVDDNQQGTADNQFSYGGASWQHCSGCGNSMYNNTKSWSSTAGDSVSITFTGTQLKFFGGLNPHGGLASITIDGSPVATINFYSPVEQGNKLLWNSPKLSNSSHTLVIQVLGDKNAASLGTEVIIDRIEIDFTEAPTPSERTEAIEPIVETPCVASAVSGQKAGSQPPTNTPSGDFVAPTNVAPCGNDTKPKRQLLELRSASVSAAGKPLPTPTLPPQVFTQDFSTTVCETASEACITQVRTGTVIGDPPGLPDVPNAAFGSFFPSFPNNTSSITAQVTLTLSPTTNTLYNITNFSIRNAIQLESNGTPSSSDFTDVLTLEFLDINGNILSNSTVNCTLQFTSGSITNCNTFALNVRSAKSIRVTRKVTITNSAVYRHTDIFYNVSISAQPIFVPSATPTRTLTPSKTPCVVIVTPNGAASAQESALSAQAKGRSTSTFTPTPQVVCQIITATPTPIPQSCPQNISIVSVAKNGAQASGYSESSAISGHGDYVVFKSFASNLTAQTSGSAGAFIFIKNMKTSDISLVTADSSGNPATGSYSDHPSISTDGRYIAFESDANNLAPNDTNSRTDVFVRDVLTGQTIMVSSGFQGASSQASISPDGKYIAWEYNDVATGSYQQIYARNISNLAELGPVILVSNTTAGTPANNASESPSVAGPNSSGQYIVTFASSASDLAGTTSNGYPHIYWRELSASTLYQVKGASGAEMDEASNAPSISGDGRWIAFESFATNTSTTPINPLARIVHIYAYDRQNPATSPILVSVGSGTNLADSSSYSPFIAGPDADGDYLVAFWSNASNLGISNGKSNAYVRNITKGNTKVVSTGTVDDSYLPRLSPEGECVTFYSAHNYPGNSVSQPNIFAVQVSTP